MAHKPFIGIYNLLAIDYQGNKLFGRYVKTRKEAKSEIINSPYIMRTDKVIFKKRIYTMKEIFLWQ